MTDIKLKGDFSHWIDSWPITPIHPKYDWLIEKIEDIYGDECAVAIVLAANGIVLPKVYQDALLLGFSDYLAHEGSKDLETSLFGRKKRLKFATRQARKFKYYGYFFYLDVRTEEFGQSATDALDECLEPREVDMKDTIYREYMRYRQRKRDNARK